MPAVAPPVPPPAAVAPRPATAGHGQRRQLPGTPTFIPITPRPRLIIVGLVLMVIGTWALFSYLPAHKPPPYQPGVTAPPPVGQLSDELYYAGNVAAVALLLIGAAVVITSSLYRAQSEVLCRECHRQVIGWRTSFGLLCPLEKHYARVDWPVLIATIAFWSLSVLLSLGLAIIILF